jgi:hypothetical protein
MEDMEVKKVSSLIRGRNIENLALDDKFPRILSLPQAAEIVGLKPSTLKRKISEGHFKDCVSAGKPVRVLRDKFVLAFFNKNKKALS